MSPSASLQAAIHCDCTASVCVCVCGETSTHTTHAYAHILEERARGGARIHTCRRGDERRAIEGGGGRGGGGIFFFLTLPGVQTDRRATDRRDRQVDRQVDEEPLLSPAL